MWGKRWKSPKVDVTNLSTCSDMESRVSDSQNSTLKNVFLYILWDSQHVDDPRVATTQNLQSPSASRLSSYTTEGDSKWWCLKGEHWILFSSFANFQYLETRSGLSPSTLTSWVKKFYEKDTWGIHTIEFKVWLSRMTFSKHAWQPHQASGPNSILTWSHHPYNG